MTTGRFPTQRNLNVEELIERYDKIIPAVDKDLENSGIADEVPIPEIPDGLGDFLSFGKYDDPLPPTDLTVVGLEVVGKLFSFFSQWTNYVQAELTRAQCESHVLKRHLKVVEAALSIWYREDQGKPAGKVSDYVTTDSRFVEIDADLMRAEVFVRKVDSRYEQLKRYLNAISREQTRRTEEMENDRHESSGPEQRRARAKSSMRSRWKPQQ